MSDSTHSGDLLIAPVPRITIQAFCETPDVAASIQAAADDRRMHKAHVKVQMGGAPAAVEAYRQAPTPNVIVLESIGDRAALLGHLDSPRRGLRRRHQGRGHRPRQRRRPLPRAHAPRHQRVPHRAGRRCSTSSRRSRTCSARRALSRSGAPSRSSAPRAASARRPSRTTSRWAIGAPARRSRPSSPISTSPSAPPASTSTRTRRRASPRRCSRPTGSTPTSSTGCCRSAATTSACSPRRRCSTAPPTSIETALDGLFDILRAIASRASSSTCRICGRRGCGAR